MKNTVCAIVAAMALLLGSALPAEAWGGYGGHHGYRGHHGCGGHRAYGFSRGFSGDHGYSTYGYGCSDHDRLPEARARGDQGQVALAVDAALQRLELVVTHGQEPVPRLPGRSRA